MQVTESTLTPGLWFALTRTGKIEKICYSEVEAKAHVQSKRTRPKLKARKAIIK